MHKKGITEEVAKKRSRRTVKHQRGIVGADLEAIKAKRTQSVQDRTQQRLAAISKAKAEKKAKEAKKPKVCIPTWSKYNSHMATDATPHGSPSQPEEHLQAAGKRWTGRPLNSVYYLNCVVWHMYHDYTCAVFLRRVLLCQLQPMQSELCGQMRVAKRGRGIPGCVGRSAGRSPVVFTRFARQCLVQPDGHRQHSLSLIL
jgi:hypothetical protein